MDPVYTSITEEQCREILNIDVNEYEIAVGAGWLMKNGPEQGESGISPRFFNVVDLAFFRSLTNLVRDNDHTGIVWDFCFDVFDTILGQDIDYPDDWYLKIKDEEEDFFNTINMKVEEIETLPDYWLDDSSFSATGEREKWSNVAMFQVCINAFAEMGLRTQILFHSLNNRDASMRSKSTRDVNFEAATDGASDFIWKDLHGHSAGCHARCFFSRDPVSAEEPPM